MKIYNVKLANALHGANVKRMRIEAIAEMYASGMLAIVGEAAIDWVRLVLDGRSLRVQRTLQRRLINKSAPTEYEVELFNDSLQISTTLARGILRRLRKHPTTTFRRTRDLAEQTLGGVCI